VQARSRSLAAVRAVPAWAWLVGIVAVSVLVRFVLARRVVAPWIMVDELIYSELAKSFADGGRFLVRGEPTGAYGFVYPVLIAPAWRVFDAVPDAYMAAKAINAVLMSLAALPAYFLARRLVAPPLALVAAVLTLLVPSMAYTGTLMTENAFYPAFLATALALVLMLESPTWRRQVLVLVAVAVAFAVRAQAVAFLPAVLTAPLLLAWFDGRRRVLRSYWVIWGVAAATVVFVPLVQLARGRPLLAVFGAYEQAGKEQYTLAGVLKWLLYHVAELDLYVGVVPFAALLLLVALARRLSRRLQAFVAATVAISAWLLIEVAAFASQNPIPPRVEERNMFYVAPLLVIALLAWIDTGLPRRHVAAGAAAAIAAALPGVLPYETLIGVSATADELMLHFWWRLQDHVISLDHVAAFALVGSTLAALLFLLVPRARAWVLPTLVAGWFVAVSWTVNDDVHGFRNAAVGALFQGINHQQRDWIDRAAGRDADVAVIWTKCSSERCPQPRSLTDEKVVWLNEFFSRSVGPVYALHDPLPGGFAEQKAFFDARTGVFTAGNRPIRARYVLTDASVDPIGSRVAADLRKGVFLWKVDRPLRKRTVVTGVYPDTWTGPRVRYLRRACRGGSLWVTLQSDPNLVGRAQSVGASSFGRAIRTVRVARGGTTNVLLPLRSRGGRCELALSVSPTKVPGAGDSRRLGVHLALGRFVLPA